MGKVLQNTGQDKQTEQKLIQNITGSEEDYQLKLIFSNWPDFQPINIELLIYCALEHTLQIASYYTSSNKSRLNFFNSSSN